ncbi:hypothetical protein GBAR_LOCUS53, partial [Geodia barretti]
AYPLGLTLVHSGSDTNFLPLHITSSTSFKNEISLFPLALQVSSPNIPMTSSTSVDLPTLALKSPRRTTLPFCM